MHVHTYLHYTYLHITDLEGDSDGSDTEPVTTPVSLC